ncbi:ABC transporter substrate-binding protein [Roseomonas sp. BN140053]|uniref:ABC transporter substrate-binding protein n=1 Tax=Roseomonas sp. BN140053 TaxID=3391898 RepID=UPI0039EC003E
MTTRRRLLGAAASAPLFTPAIVRAAETVKVGVVGTFSGPFARWGEQFRQAIQVFQAQRGRTVDGNPIEVIYRDDGGADPSRAKQLTEALILRDKVRFLGGYVFTPNILSVAELVTEATIPTVIFNAPTAFVTRRSPMFVRTSHTIPAVAEPIAEWGLRNGVSRVVTAVSDYTAGFDSEAAFLRAFRAGGGTVLESMRIPLATTDFSPFFERVAAQRPDAIFIFAPGGPPAVGMIRTWAARLKPAGIRLLCTAETQEIDLPLVGPDALGVVSAFHYTETVDNPLNLALRAKLVEMFGPATVPDLASVGAYDGMELIYRAVAAHGPRVTAQQALGTWRGLAFDSPRGPIQIDARERDIVENIYLRRVEQRDGRLVNVNIATFPMVRDPWKDQNPA